MRRVLANSFELMDSAASKTPLSGASTYSEIGNYWDRNDLSQHWDETREVEMEIDPQSSRVYFALDKALAAKLRSAAESRGVSAEALLNLWLEEHAGSE
jgi:hypothetical protein